MVLRTFFAIDNENLIVDSSSNGALVGNGIINNSATPDGTVFTFSSGGGTSVTIDDTARRNRFDDDDPSNHVVDDGGGIVADGTEVEAESTIFVRALDNNGTPIGPEIAITVFSQNGNTGDVWGFATDAPLINGVSYIKVGGDNDGTARYSNFIPCFEASTTIKTLCGAKSAKDIAVGDMVWTQDRGYQAVRWVGQRQLSELELAMNPKLRPVRIMQDALGTGFPKHDLVVSRQHRILVRSEIAQRMFGNNEVLIPAIKLTGLPGVFIDEALETVDYVHLLFDEHEIICAEGAQTESLFTGPEALKAVSAQAKEEILAIFPEVATLDYGPEPARHIPSGKLQRQLVSQHLMKSQPLFCKGGDD